MATCRHTGRLQHSHKNREQGPHGIVVDVMRILTPLLLSLALAPDATSQATPRASNLLATAQQLRNVRLQASAMHDLMQAKGDGATAVWQSFVTASAANDSAAETFAKALADLGPNTSHILDALVAQLAQHEEPLRSHLLRALSNGALFSTTAQRDQIRAAAKTWAAAGHLYSPTAEQPTFAWYEYVRLVRRLSLADRGHDKTAIHNAMAKLRQERGAAPIFGQRPAANAKHPHCAIESFGAHGQRELLEGIAELATRCTDVSDEVLDELASYLTYSPPRSPRIRTEHCAGIGENAPNALPGAKWPTNWLYDDWHFACAEAVLLRSSDQKARSLALRHLLYASNTTMRLHAIETVRQWPKPWTAFAPDLKQCLAADDRTIVRATLLTIGQDKQLVLAIRAELQRLQAGTDRELAVMAKQALRTSN